MNIHHVPRIKAMPHVRLMDCSCNQWTAAYFHARHSDERQEAKQRLQEMFARHLQESS